MSICFLKLAITLTLIFTVSVASWNVHHKVGCVGKTTEQAETVLLLHTAALPGLHWLWCRCSPATTELCFVEGKECKCDFIKPHWMWLQALETTKHCSGTPAHWLCCAPPHCRHTGSQVPARLGYEEIWISLISYNASHDSKQKSTLCW